MTFVLDVLGARLQYERMGVELYDALIAMFDRETANAPRNTSQDAAAFMRGPRRSDLITMREQERAHVDLATRLIAELGGDVNVLTPIAKREITMAHGIAEVVRDTSMSLLDGLEAMVVAEMSDREQWLGLVEVAREIGRDDLARTFMSAQAVEDDHLSKIRSWISAGRHERT